MEYLLLIYEDEAVSERMSEADMKARIGAYTVLEEEMQKAGVIHSARRLDIIGTASSVRLRDGESTATDGPFAETKEQLAGFFLLDCDSREDALKWAAKIPSAETGTIEVRPIWRSR